MAARAANPGPDAKSMSTAAYPASEARRPRKLNTSSLSLHGLPRSPTLYQVRCALVCAGQLDAAGGEA